MLFHKTMITVFSLQYKTQTSSDDEDPPASSEMSSGDKQVLRYSLVPVSLCYFFLLDVTLLAFNWLFLFSRPLSHCEVEENIRFVWLLSIKGKLLALPPILFFNLCV